MERRKGWRLALLALVLAGLLLPVALALAQASFQLDWWTVDAGGGQLQGGAYTLTGTLGQADAGEWSGGGYQLLGGFWGLVSTPQTLYLPAILRP